MTANTSPIFTLTPTISWAKITTADTGSDGTGANVASIMTAGASGSFLYKLILQPYSSSGSTTTSSAIARVYINNGSTAGTAANNSLIKEIPLPPVAVVTGAGSAYSASAYGFDIPFNIQIPASYVVLVGITALAANTGWQVSSIAGSY